MNFRSLAFLLVPFVAAAQDATEHPDLAEPPPESRDEEVSATPETVTLLVTLIAAERAVLEQAGKDRLEALDALRSAALEQARASTDVAVATRTLANGRAGATTLHAARELHRAAEDSLARASRAMTEAAARGEVLRGAIETSTVRVEALLVALDEARRATGTSSAPPLQGTWDVTMETIDDRGVFKLVQVGTLVSGTYTMASGHVGSFQGAFVDRKVQMERVDARSGRDITFYGRLGNDGNRITGNWESRLLGMNESSFGNWTAIRRQPRSPPTEPNP